MRENNENQLFIYALMTPHCDEQVKANKNYKQNTKLIISFMKSLQNENKLKL